MKIGLALSGGGFRATLYHLGVVTYLKKAKLLGNVRYIASVSGGSIISAHMALNWESYQTDIGFARMSEDIRSFTNRDVRGRAMRRWPLSAPCGKLFTGTQWGMTGLLQRELARLYSNKTLNDLQRPDLLVEILGTSMSNGRPAAFRSDGRIFVDWSLSKDDMVPAPRTPITLAVSASAAFPPLFPPVKISWETLGVKENLFPLPHFVTDGGIFDNLGMQMMEWTDASERLGLTHILMSDAGMPFNTTHQSAYKNPLSRQQRAFDVAMARNAELLLFTLRDNPDFFSKVIECRIDSLVFDDIDGQKDRLHQDSIEKIPSTRTDFDAFSTMEAELIVRHGFIAAQKAIRNFEGHPNSESTKFSIPHLSLPELVLSRAKLRRKDFRAGQKIPWYWDFRDWLSLVYALAICMLIVVISYLVVFPLVFWSFRFLARVFTYLSR